MIESTERKSSVLAGSAVLTLALGVAGCSAPADGGGSAPWGTAGSSGGGSGSTNAGTASSGSSGASTSRSGGSGSSSGSSSSSGAGSTGSSSSGGNPTSSGSSSSGAASSSSSSGGASANGIPTAQGFTTGPPGATDLAAPPTDIGIQFATPPGAFTVSPGQEIFPNYCVTLANGIQVGGFQSWMTVGSSHHFILYNGGTGSSTGTGTQCTMGGFAWLYATSTPGQVVTENFPPNVGLSLPASTHLIINMHFINPGSSPSSPQVKINLLYAKNVMYQAGTLVSFNTSINVPAGSATAPGTQTVSGTCTAPVGANFFSMSTHTHKHATAAWVEYVHGGQTTEIVHTGTTAMYPADQEPGSGTDWEHPGVGLWVSPNYLTVQSGDSFKYHCAYSNTSSMNVMVGETAASNEMCMAVGYYFPAGMASCN